MEFLKHFIINKEKKIIKKIVGPLNNKVLVKEINLIFKMKILKFF